MKSVFTAVFLAAVFSLPSYGYDWATNPGDGNPENPYQISEPNQLIAIGSDPNLLDKCFILTSDITFDPNNNPAHVFTKALIAPDLDPDLIYFQGPAFEGTLNGNQHKLLHLKFISPLNDYLGLFGEIGWNGTVKNLILENVIIEGNENIGGLAGHNNGIVSNSYTNCSIIGERQTGGMIGWNEGSVTVCSSIGIVNCDSTSIGVGGMIGLIKGGSISNCFSNVDCFGGHNIGGLAGFIDAGGIITSCYAEGSITGTGSNIGGLVGSIANGSVSYCYSTGLVSGTDAGDGGLVGKSYGTITASYFLDTAGPDNGLGTPLTFIQMLQRGSFIGWDFVDDGTDGPNNIWRMCKDYHDFPRLSWEFAEGGDYACPDAVWMEDLEELAFNWLNDDSDTNFNYACDGFGDGQIQNDDLDVLSENWLVGVPPFLKPCSPQVSISVYEHGPNPSPVPFCLSNTGRREGEFALDYLPSQPDWLDITPSQGIALPGQGTPLSISIDVVGPDLAPGSYDQPVQITSPDAENSPIFTVHLHVINRFPVPAVDPNELSFYTDEGGPNPLPQTVVLSNTGNEDMDYSIDYPGGKPSWLDVTPSSGTVNKNSQMNLTVSIDVVGSALLPGQYSQAFRITDQSGQADSLTVTVALEVNDLVPVLTLNMSSLSFSADEGGPNPSPKAVKVTNVGAETSEFAITYPGGQPSWLSVSPASGSLPVGYATFLSVYVDVIGPALTPGTYTRSFEVTDPEDPFSPHPVTVVLNVNP